MAAVALPAQDEPVPAAGAADAGLRRRRALHQLLQLPDLVQLPYLLGAADVAAADEHPRQRQRPPLAAAVAEDLLELRQEAGVHRQVPLVDPHAEAAQDGSDGLAVLEGRPHHAQAGEVDDNAVAVGGPGERDGLRLDVLGFGFGFGLGLGRGDGAGAKERRGGGEGGTEEDGAVPGGEKRGGRLGAEGLDVLEGGA